MSAENADGRIADCARPDEREHQRALWRSRRGMLELDLMLVAFARQRYPHLPAAQRGAYRELLDAEDALIWAWLQGRATPPSALAHVLDSIIAFNAKQESP